MAVPIRRMLRRKWLQAAGNIESAQKYLLEIQTYYKENHPENVEATDAGLLLAEELHTYLLDCSKFT